MTNTEDRQRRLNIQLIGTPEEENQSKERNAVKTIIQKHFYEIKKYLRLHFESAQCVPENINSE